MLVPKEILAKLDRLLALHEVQTVALTTLARARLAELKERDAISPHEAAHWHSELDAAERLIGK